MARRADPERKIVEATQALIEEGGLARLTLAAVARRAGMTLATLYAHAASRSALVGLLIRRIDLAVLEAAPEPNLQDTPRDRLFDILMTRFEALGPIKPALRVIYHDLRRAPGDAVALLPALTRAMRWMVEAAGLDTTGLGGAARIRALAALYVSLLPTWLAEDDPGLPRTMAALDRRLRRAEELWRGVWGPSPGAPAPASDEAPAADTGVATSDERLH